MGGFLGVRGLGLSVGGANKNACTEFASEIVIQGSINTENDLATPQTVTAIPTVTAT